MKYPILFQSFIAKAWIGVSKNDQCQTKRQKASNKRSLCDWFSN